MFANRDIVALAPRWFGKTVSTASAPCLDKEEIEWRQRQMEVGQEKPGAPKRTRALSAEELRALLAQRCQQLERANGRLSESRIKNAGREIIGKDDRKECGRRCWSGPGVPALSALAPNGAGGARLEHPRDEGTSAAGVVPARGHGSVWGPF